MSFQEYASIVHEVPYVYSLESGGKVLNYYGTCHSRQPTDKIHNALRESFLNFRPDVLLLEGHFELTRNYEEYVAKHRSLGWADAISESGEGGGALFLATKNGVQAISAELSIRTQVEILEKRGFIKDELFMFFVFRMLAGGQEFSSRDSLVSYVAGLCVQFSDALGWKDYDMSLSHLMVLHARYWGIGEVSGESSYYAFRTWPTPRIELQPYQTRISEVARAVHANRDCHAVQTLESLLTRFDRVFVVSGASHAVQQEPALRLLMSGGVRENS